MIRVVVKASTSVIRAGLESLVREDPRLAVVSSGKPTHRADVVLVDLDDTARLSSVLSTNQLDAAPIVLLADELSRSEIRRALHSGVRAVLGRNATSTELVAALEAVAAGLTALGSDEFDVLLPPSTEPPDDELPGESLSSRETQVLTMLAEGMPNREIASRLEISEHTVKFHVSSILGKLGVASRGEAVARGVREGLIWI